MRANRRESDGKHVTFARGAVRARTHHYSEQTFFLRTPGISEKHRSERPERLGNAVPDEVAAKKSHSPGLRLKDEERYGRGFNKLSHKRRKPLLQRCERALTSSLKPALAELPGIHETAGCSGFRLILLSPPSQSDLQWLIMGISSAVTAAGQRRPFTGFLIAVSVSKKAKSKVMVANNGDASQGLFLPGQPPLSSDHQSTGGSRSPHSCGSARSATQSIW